MTVMERYPEALRALESQSTPSDREDGAPYTELLNPLTGELFLERTYHPQPWRARSEASWAPESLFIAELTSLNQRDRFMARVDKRRLVRHNACRYIFDHERGASSLDGRRPLFTKPVYRTMDKLVRLLDYQNYLYTTADDLAEQLEIHPKSVTRQLRSLGALVRVRSQREGMRKGVLQIAVSPAYGYRMEPESINQLRYKAARQWYWATSKPEFDARFELTDWGGFGNFPDYDLPVF